MLDPALRAMVSVFSERLMVIVERLVRARSRELARALIRERKIVMAEARAVARADRAAKARRRSGRRKQLCPIPGCENVAAPIYGMLCREHKDLPAGVVKKYRAERRGDFSHLMDAEELIPMVVEVAAIGANATGL